MSIKKALVVTGAAVAGAAAAGVTAAIVYDKVTQSSGSEECEGCTESDACEDCGEEDCICGGQSCEPEDEGEPAPASAGTIPPAGIFMPTPVIPEV